ncbi:MAG: ABC transporter ATP-binding protein [Solobacterium sp.]|nr:ABC transporter ATP-binding protein [Solobacterium sp.]
MILDLQNIYKNYGNGDVEVPALKNVTFRVEEGEYVAIMGPSGSGKTTLMNIIGCLDRQTSGTYILDGTNIADVSEKDLSGIRLNKIGFVFQTFQLLPGETALENVALPLIYAGVKKQDREERAMQALKDVGLEDRASFRPSQLSGGQKQRTAIARAMINNPKILLADEPTGALDQASGRQVMALFKSLNDAGVTIVMITHDANVAANAKRILHIIDGEISEVPGGEL